MLNKINELKRFYFKIAHKHRFSDFLKFKEKYANYIKDISYDIPPADIVDILNLKNNINAQVNFFRLLHKGKIVQVFSMLEIREQEAFLKILNPEEIEEILKEMDPDDRVELFEELPGVLTRKLLNLLDKESKDELFNLLGYPEYSIGRLMTPDYITIRPNWTIAQALEHVRKWGDKSETSNVTYVTDKDWKLIGVISLRNLVINDPQILVSEKMKEPVISIFALDDQEEAYRKMQKYDLSVLPVVDNFYTLVGIVTADDVFDVAEEEITEDFQKSSAVEAFTENFLYSNVFFLFKKRITWLIMLTFINLIAGAIILSFEQMLEKAVVLVSFMPLLIGSAGNSGSQSATLAIRAMAVGDVKSSDWFKLLLREVSIAFLLGLVMGFLASMIGLFRGDLIISLIVGITMVIVVLLGSLFGISLPFILNKFKLDPAVASSPLVASVADVFGVLIYLLIAKIFLNL